MLRHPGSYSPTVLTARQNGHPKHWSQRLFYRFVVVPNGEHHISIDGKSQHIPKGGIYLIPPMTEISVDYNPDIKPLTVDFLVIHSPLIPQENGRGFTIKPGTQPQPSPQEIWGVDLGIEIPEAIRQWVKARLQLISGIWWRSDREHFKANMRLNEILEHLTDKSDPETTFHFEEGPAWLGAIERACTTRVQTIHTVDDLADIAGMSIAHFSRCFRHATGHSPAKWLRQRRMAVAADLLRSSGLPIQEIAENVGIPRVTTFNQVWRQIYHCAPSEWRNVQLGR